MPEAVALGDAISYLPATGPALESFAMFRPVTSFLWAGREVAISHDDVPVKGTMLVDRSLLEDREFRDRFCLDAA